jgi:hypothetical protein
MDGRMDRKRTILLIFIIPINRGRFKKMEGKTVYSDYIQEPSEGTG